MLFELTVIAFLLYLVGITYLRKHPEKIPDWMSLWSGIFILVHSEKGLDYIEKIAERTPLWKPIGNLGAGFAVTVMISIFLLTIFSAISILTTEAESAITEPRNYLVVPGVNDFLPLSVALEILLALGAAMIIHELGHAIYCKYEGIEVKSTGIVLLGLLPFGAFVEPDLESQDNASRLSRLRMASAGVFNNTVLTVISVVLLMLTVSFLITPISGASIGSTYANSASADAEIGAGDTIIEVNGQEIQSNSEFQEYLSNSDARTVEVTLQNGETVTVNRKAQVSGVLESSDLSTGDVLTHINGEEIHTTNEFQTIIHNQDTNNVEFNIDGQDDTITHQTGATYIAQTEFTIDETTINSGDVLRVTEVNNEIIHSSGQAEIESGDEITVVSNEDTTISGTVSDSFTEQTTTVSGVNGLEISDFGASLYPVQEYYSVLNGDLVSENFLAWVVLMLMIPLGTLIGFDHNFPGFTTEIGNHFTVIGGSMAEPVIFFTATLLFWMVWINFNVAIFNCLPTFALDGGHILRDFIKELWVRVGFAEESSIPGHLTTVILVLTASLLLAIIVSPFF